MIKYFSGLKAINQKPRGKLMLYHESQQDCRTGERCWTGEEVSTKLILINILFFNYTSA